MKKTNKYFLQIHFVEEVRETQPEMNRVLGWHTVRAEHYFAAKCCLVIGALAAKLVFRRWDRDWYSRERVIQGFFEKSCVTY